MYEDESKAGLALMPSRSWSESGTHITLTTLSTMSQKNVNKVRAAMRRKHYIHSKALWKIKNTPLLSSLCISLSLHLGSYVGKSFFHVATVKTLSSWQRRDLVLLIFVSPGPSPKSGIGQILNKCVLYEKAFSRYSSELALWAERPALAKTRCLYSETNVKGIRMQGLLRAEARKNSVGLECSMTLSTFTIFG